MDLSTKIYSKTGKGTRALSSKSRELPANALKLLSLVDSKTDAASILTQFGKLPESEFRILLAQLENGGYIRAVHTQEWDWGDAKSDFRDAMVVEELSADDFFALAPEPEPDAGAKSAEEQARQAAADQAQKETLARELAEMETRLKAERKAREAEAARLKAEAQQQAKREAEAQAKAEAERRTRVAEEARRQAEDTARLNAERVAREEAERKARAAEEARRKAEAEARARAEQAARLEAERIARAEDEARRKAEAEARLAAERVAREEAERKARAAEEARLQAEAEARAQAEQAARREAERKAQEAEEAARLEAERTVRAEEDERRRAEAEARLAAERVAREEAERKARAAEEARLQAEAEARARAEQAARLEAERSARAEEESRRKAEAEARLAAERVAREEAERKARAAEEARLQAEAEARAQAELAARLEAERSARAEEESRRKAEAETLASSEQAARLEAERMAQEAEETRRRAEEAARLEAERIAREEDEARREAEMQARLEAERVAREEAERKARAAEEARLRAEAETRVLAEEAARQEAARLEREAKEARLTAKAEARAKAEAEARDKAREKAERRAEQVARPMAKRRAAPPSRWSSITARAFFLYVPLALAVLVGLLHFVNLRVLAPPIEQLAAESIGEPVRISEVRVTLFPRQRLRLAGVEIGADRDIRVGAVQVSPAVLLQAGAVKTLDSLAIEQMEVDGQTLGRQLQWLGTLARTGKLSIRQLALNDIAFKIPGLAPASFEGRVELQPSGAPGPIELRSADHNLNILLTPRDGAYEVALHASNWQPPAGAPLQFSEFSAQGVADGKQVRFRRIEGRLYGGSVKGKAVVDWSAQPSASGSFELADVSLPVALSSLGSSAALDGSLKATASFASRAQEVGKLTDAPEISARFVVTDGQIHGVDLARPMVPGGGSINATRFDRLTGHLQLRNGQYQYRGLVLDSAQFHARGSLDIRPNQDIAGTISAELALPSRLMRSTLSLSGKVGDVRMQ